MNNHDNEMLHRARCTTGYGELTRLYDLAESEECKGKIEDIMLRLYRQEEAKGGMQ